MGIILISGVSILIFLIDMDPIHRLLNGWFLELAVLKVKRYKLKIVFLNA